MDPDIISKNAELAAVNAELAAAIEEKKALEDSEAEILDVRGKINGRFDSTLSEIEKQLNSFDHSQTFHQEYMEKAKAIIHGSDSQNAINEYDSAYKKCETRIATLEDDIERYRGQIDSLEHEISTLSIISGE